MSARDEAVALLSYYFGRSRDDWTSKNEAEIEAAVDYIIDAAAARQILAIGKEIEFSWADRKALFRRLRVSDVDAQCLIDALEFCVEHLQGAPLARLFTFLNRECPAGQKGTDND